jgi:hypothetical protein
MAYVKTQAKAWTKIVVTYNGTAITEITTVPAPQFTPEKLDATNQDSNGVKEFILGLLEGSEIEFKGNYVGTDTGQTNLSTAADNGDIGLWNFAFPSGLNLSFYGLVETFDIVPDRNIISFSCKVKVTSKPVKSTNSPSALTGLATTAGTLSPTFSGTKYDYVVSSSGNATCTVTPTLAGGTITVNGVSVATGQASGDISIATGVVTTIYVLCSTASTSPTLYRLHVNRTA